MSRHICQPHGTWSTASVKATDDLLTWVGSIFGFTSCAHARGLDAATRAAPSLAQSRNNLPVT